jgi:glucose-6-phosphate isomerase
MKDFIRPEQRPAWTALSSLAQDPQLTLPRLLQEPDRTQTLCFSAAGLTLDVSCQRVDHRVLKALFELAQQSQVMDRARQMVQGKPLNFTEGRPALHMALRDPGAAHPPWGQAIGDQIQLQLDRFLRFAEQARAGQWLGHDQRPITDVVNLGIGGSDLGPRMASHALATDRVAGVRVHHVSNVDADALQRCLSGLQPARTGFIVQSKTFTTQETLTLFHSAQRWLTDGGCPADHMVKHLVAVTAKPDLALAQGFLPEQTFLFWDWVGGRYSVWSAIGLPLAMAIGGAHFKSFLQGARDMDQHFLSAEPERNLPLIMALCGVWNGNFLQARTLHIAPYAFGLGQFVPYVQQLEMESNGKRIHWDGSTAQIQTAPVIWGGLGIDGQHAYFQLLHQGSQLVPVDFIGVRHSASDMPLASQHQQVVLQNMQAQAQALAWGRHETQTAQALLAEGLSPEQVQMLTPHRTYAGNVPSSTIWLDQLDPAGLGALLALYEHKVFCQSVLWGINAYDQWGVELGKTLFKQMAHRALER